MEVKVAALKELLHWQVRILFNDVIIEFETTDLRLETVQAEAQKKFSAVGEYEFFVR